MKAFKLFTAFLLVMVCICLSSCSKDKDKDKGDNDVSSLVGTWVWSSETSSMEEWIVFKADGTGVTWEVWKGKSSPKYPFTYVFNEKTSVLTIIVVGGDNPDDTVSGVVTLLTDKELVLERNGKTFVYYKQ